METLLTNSDCTMDLNELDPNIAVQQRGRDQAARIHPLSRDPRPNAAPSQPGAETFLSHYQSQLKDCRSLLKMSLRVNKPNNSEHIAKLITKFETYEAALSAQLNELPKAKLELENQQKINSDFQILANK